MRSVDLGIDLGGTGVRAAFGPRGEAEGFVELKGTRWPWLAYEPPGPGGVAAFPAWKSRLGAPAGGADDPEARFARALGELRDRVREAAPEGPRRTVIAVPARFESRRRTALLRAAAAAGLGEVSLLSDSLAAVIGRAPGSPDGLVMAFGMGYTGFEIGLVDAAGPRYRVLGYEGATAGSGAALDERIARWYLDTRGDQEDGPEPPGGEPAWRRLRQAAEDIKEGLAAGRTRIPLPDIARRLQADRFTVEAFEQMAADLVSAALRRADALVAETGADWSAVRQVLLYGGTASLPVASAIAGRRGRPVAVASARVLATGALRHAAGTSAQEPHAAQRKVEAPPRTAPPPGHRLQAPLVTVADEPAAEAGLAAAAKLLADGRVDEAEQAALTALAAAEDLLARIRSRRAAPEQAAPAASAPDTAAPPEPPGPARPPARSKALLLREAARRQIAAGRPDEAVRLAHRAWNRDGTDLELFDEVVKVHIEAAMDRPAVDDFERQQGWLKCAYHHDPGNPRILDLLAERAYLHGTELKRAGRLRDAREALRQALSWNPDHQGADDLLRRLKRLS